MFRHVLTLIHRWFGLVAAVFLFIAGATGAMLVWNQELDALLNPQLFHARASGPAPPVAEIVRRVEAADPRLRIRLPAPSSAGANGAPSRSGART